jgi:hypothetical protein
LRHADDDDALVGGGALAIARDHVVLALAGLERNQRDVVPLRKRGDRSDEAIVEWLEERGRRNRMPEVLLEEVAEPAGGLQLRERRIEEVLIEQTPAWHQAAGSSVTGERQPLNL